MSSTNSNPILDATNAAKVSRDFAPLKALLLEPAEKGKELRKIIHINHAVKAAIAADDVELLRVFFDEQGKLPLEDLDAKNDHRFYNTSLFLHETKFTTPVIGPGKEKDLKTQSYEFLIGTAGFEAYVKEAITRSLQETDARVFNDSLQQLVPELSLCEGDYSQTMDILLARLQQIGNNMGGEAPKLIQDLISNRLSFYADDMVGCMGNAQNFSALLNHTDETDKELTHRLVNMINDTLNTVDGATVRKKTEAIKLLCDHIADRELLESIKTSVTTFANTHQSLALKEKTRAITTIIDERLSTLANAGKKMGLFGKPFPRDR